MSQEDAGFARTFSTMVIALTVFGIAMIFLARHIEKESLPVRETHLTIYYFLYLQES